MPRLNIHTTHQMTEKQRKDWEDRAKRGGAYKVLGAFRDEVYVPRTTSDVNPRRSEQWNQLRLDRIREMIEYNRNLRKRKYIG